MKTYLFIDLSYFIFYLYYARKKYFEFQKKDTTDLINNPEFLDGFANFDIKLKQIKKNLRLPEDVIIIFSRDCRRKDIWRNDIYPQYKQSRKVNNEVGEFFIYVYNNLMDKYIYLENNRCEADDVIGVLTKNLYKDNKIYIITGDHDYLQLLYNDNVQIYTMKMKSLREKSSGDRYTDLMMKILTGDSSDNIFAIHKKLGPKTAMKYITNEEELKKKCEDETIKENLDRNKKLIDMENIPENYKKEIIDKFELLNL
jgi:5'-3' exonuclease